ncbi:MAG: type IV secretory system conjugative DNA transfer family protein [Desulfurococcales archaeon]|nr:type IV secretory system conjugative DNA transfer family protein [Desulfurococcales archaeon]
MGILDIVLGAMAITTLVLMIRNLSDWKPYGPKGIVSKLVNDQRASHEIIIRGKRLKPVVYVGEPLPLSKNTEYLGMRLSALIRLSGMNATIAGTLIREEKNVLLKKLEKEIEKARLAYEATNHVRHLERLRYLEKLYSDVIKEIIPYSGSTILIVWLEEGEDESKANALKTMIEVETGIRLNRSMESIVESLVSQQGPANSASIPIIQLEQAGGDLVILGYHPEYRILEGLLWPDDFETHLGVMGPTGKGKTVLVSGIITQLYYRFEEGKKPSILVIDPKGDLVKLLSRTIKEVKILETLEAIDNICSDQTIMVLSGETAGVYGREALARVLNCVLRGDNKRKILVVIDEAWRYMSIAEKYLEESIREGRSKGLYIVYASQSPLDFPPRIVENTGTLIVFGGHVNTYIESVKALGIDAPDLKYLPVGVAYVKKKDRIPVKVRIFNFEEYIKNPVMGLQLQGERGKKIG